MSRRWRAVAAVAVLLTAGCGVRAEDEPRALDTGAEAYRLVTRDEPRSVGTFQASVYLVRESRLARIIRQVPSRPTPPVVLRALLAGPTASEQARGLSTALGVEPDATVVRQEGSVVVVDLPPRDADSRSDAVLGYGQVVCSLTEVRGVSGVRFVRGEQPLPVPRGDGSLVPGPLSCLDYRELVAR